jgi:hypothetical protein
MHLSRTVVALGLQCLAQTADAQGLFGRGAKPRAVAPEEGAK